jgi:hypothetical protein
VLFVPIVRGADVMVCDEVCLRSAADRLSAVEPRRFDASEVCVTCFSCGLTVPGIRCPCSETGLSCSAHSWLLSRQPHDALDAIYAAVGPTALADDDWDYLLARSEEVDAGGLVGLLWVREQHPGTGR